MARIRRWKEKLLVAWVTLFTSFVWARPRSRTPAEHSSAARTLLLTGSRGKRAWGVGLSTSKPYVRTLIASAMPVALPVAVGAFAASAGATADLAGAATAANSSCTSSPSCITSQATNCTKSWARTTCCNPYNTHTCVTRGDYICRSCYSVETCQSGYGEPTLCRTCGHGTCGVMCS